MAAHLYEVLVYGDVVVAALTVLVEGFQVAAAVQCRKCILDRSQGQLTAPCSENLGSGAFPESRRVICLPQNNRETIRHRWRDTAILEVLKQPHPQPNKMFLHLASNTPVNTGPPLKKVVRGRQWRFCPPQPVG